MKKIFFVAICLTFLLSACSSSKIATTVEKAGMSFTCPAGWEITEEVYEADGVTQHITIERKGLSKTGMVSIMLSSDAEDEPEIAIEEMREFFRALYVFNKMKVFDVKDGTYGKYSAIYFDNLFIVNSVLYENRVSVFESEGKQVFVFQLSAQKDKKKNNRSFAEIEQSFSVK